MVTRRELGSLALGAGVAMTVGIPETGIIPEAMDMSRRHQHSDVDQSPLAQHHTLGYGSNQAAPGNHVHDGASSKLVNTAISTLASGWSRNTDSLAEVMHLDLPSVGYYKVTFEGIIRLDVAGVDFHSMFAASNGLVISELTGTYKSMSASDLNRILRTNFTSNNQASRVNFNTDSGAIIPAMVDTYISDSVLLKVIHKGRISYKGGQLTPSGAHPVYIDDGATLLASSIGTVNN